MTPDSPRPIFYAFGNHMHWVDMEWLWGYHALPGSIRDMLHFCRETGARGGVNFDGVGYEKLAAEDPEALAELRQAIAEGTIEPVGCSYGQPYGLFHGGESNVRQRVYGVRTAMRLLGFRPRTFWEEEFDFFPQLPQMLKSCGFQHASLFFQWTWHTPEIPKEGVPVIWWEGVDGSRLKTATRNRLNLHQWPEDFDGLLDGLAAEDPADESAPLILQWLELMPSPDWMCRSEVLLPRMKELLADPRFEVRFGTLGDYLAAQPDELPVRHYTMDQVWHGMSLGKNGDRIRRQSWQAERTIAFAESLAAVASLFGRPYAQWDVYPVWEVEEAWRELLQAQHHDNDECEALCGRVGMRSYQRAVGLAEDVIEQQLSRLSQEDTVRTRAVLADGWQVAEPETPLVPLGDGIWTFDEAAGALVGPGLRVGLKQLKASFDQEVHSVHTYSVEDRSSTSVFLAGNNASLVERASIHVCVNSHPDPNRLNLGVHCHPLNQEPDPGLNAGWQLPFLFDGFAANVIADTPFAAYEVGEGSCGSKKYPTGDWMTSPQWFETIKGAFTSQSFVDVVDEGGSGCLILHDGAQQWFVDPGEGVRALLGMVDAWDEDAATSDSETEFQLIRHGPIRHSERFRLSSEWRKRNMAKDFRPELPSEFVAYACQTPSVLPTAFYREAEDYSGKGLANYAGRGMGYPFVLRLVEFDGEPAEVDLILAGPIASAFKTNLMGEVEARLTPEGIDAAELDERPLRASPEDLAPFGIVPQRLRFTMRPNEIATLYLDLVPGRKQTRDLDAKREVWATIHRTGEP